MKIGLNLLYLLPGVVGGTETYAAGLLAGLAAVDRSDEFLIFVNQEARNWPIPDAPNFSRVVCPVSGASRGQRYLFEQLRMPGILREHAVDVLHSLGYVSPLRVPCASVVTIPDLNYRVWGREMSRLRRMVLGFFVKQSAVRSSRVVTLSMSAREEIVTEFRLPSDRVVITHAAPHVPRYCGARCVSQVQLQSPYIVAFSSTTPNKNIPRLVEAFERLRSQHRLPHQLVLVGHGRDPGLAARAQESGVVRFTGYLQEDDLQVVLAGAQMLAFPSVYEGFGLPVLEAMASGVPVVCSDRASLPEVAGDAAVFFDPYSVEDIAEKLARVALSASLRKELIAKGYQNLERFSWEKTARDTLQVYRDVISEKSGMQL